MSRTVRGHDAVDETTFETERILIFDGQCGFCRDCVRWIAARWRPGAPPRAVAWQNIDVELPRCTPPSRDQMSQSVWWIEGERRDAGSRAVARALMAADAPWRHLGAALLRPPLSWGADVVYRIVARHRHQLPGGTATCRLPEPDA